MKLTLGVLNDARDLALHDGDGRVGGTQINTNDGALDLLLTLGSSRLEASESGCQRGSEGSLAGGQGGSSGKLEKKLAAIGVRRQLPLLL